MIGALVGGFVGGYIGAGMRSPKVVVHERVKERWHDIDYDRLAKKVIDNLKQERIQAINDRKSELLQMEEARKCTCAKCGKEIVCWDATISRDSEYFEVDYKFRCNCKTETLREKCPRDYFYNSGIEAEFYPEDAIRIVCSNANDPICFEMAVNANKNAFRYVFERASARWEMQSDIDKKNGKSPYAVEIERLNAMLNDPLGLAEGLGIGTSASNGSTLMLAMDKE